MPDSRHLHPTRPISALPPRRVALGDGAAALVLAGLCLLAFTPALTGEFLNWDDDRNFINNESFRGLGPEQLRWAWNTYHLGVWQPLAWLQFGAQFQVRGLDPRVFHAVSLFWHALNALLLYVLLRRLILARDTLCAVPKPPGTSAIPSAGASGALVAAALFAVHPLRVEVAAWISCQPYLPAASFCLLSALAYLRAKRPDAPRRAWLGWWAASILAYAAAVGFKAAAVTLPIVLLLIDGWMRAGEAPATGGTSSKIQPVGMGKAARVSAASRSPRRTDLAKADRLWRPESRGSSGAGGGTVIRLLAEKLPYFAIAVPVCVWAIDAKDFADARAPLTDFSPSARWAQSAAGLALYLLRTALPVGLTPYDRLHPDVAIGTPRYAVAAALVTAAAVVLILRRRKQPGMFVAFAAYFVILLPNLGIVQISRQLTADRYAYLATMPLAALIAFALTRLQLHFAARHRRFLAAGAVMIVLLLAALVVAARRQSSFWRDSETLWTRVLTLDPDCAVGHSNLAEALMRRGDYPAASMHLSRAIDLEPDFPYAYVNFAALLLEAGRPKDALTAARHALDADPPLADPDRAKAHAACGEACALLGRFDEARRHTLTARALGFAAADRMLEYLDRADPKAQLGETSAGPRESEAPAEP